MSGLPREGAPQDEPSGRRAGPLPRLYITYLIGTKNWGSRVACPA